MLVYISVFIAILIAALHVRFFYTAIVNKDILGRHSNKPIATTDGSGKDQEEWTGFKSDSDLLVPSVHEDGLVSPNLGEKHPANPVVSHNLKSARLIYEKGLLTMNKSYKARRRAESRPLTLEMESKPFTRKVAPWAKDNRNAIRPWKAQECQVKIAEPTYSELRQIGSGNSE